MRKKIILSLSSFVIVLTLQAQLFSTKNYPKGYFQWPVGAKIGLAANFGELRPNHFHMGLDCRTDQKVNMPIYAAADGYIAKVKIEPFGFGRAIYINHPNGLTTLYAHLNDFYPELEEYVRSQQYKMKQWKIFIDIPSNLFPVKKAAFIAYSGNTGGSQGPHLHFEIRDTKTDKVLNPLLFDFPVADTIAPNILRLGIYDRRLSTYEQSPQLLPVKKTKEGYTIGNGKIKLKTDRVSFAITAYDRYTGSTNQNGIYKAELLYKGWPIVGFEMDSISYDETRYLNAHIDYKTKANGGPYLQHLSRLPGYENGIYKNSPWEDGIITLTDTMPVPITIRVTDANENVSELSFTIQRDSILSVVNTSFTGTLFKPGVLNVLEKSNIGFYLSEKSLYDAFHFNYAETGAKNNPTYLLHGATVPVQTYFPVWIKPSFAVKDTGRLIMKRSWGRKEDYKRAHAGRNGYKSFFRELGNYQLIEDSIAPVIKPLGNIKNGSKVSALKKISFLVTDNTEDIQSFTATVDGEWLLFSNDKGRVFTYEFDDHFPIGEHELKIVVKDMAGNTSEKIYKLIR
jgi:hypothetical protein